MGGEWLGRACFHTLLGSSIDTIARVLEPMVLAVGEGVDALEPSL